MRINAAMTKNCSVALVIWSRTEGMFEVDDQELPKLKSLNPLDIFFNQKVNKEFIKKQVRS